MDLLKRDVAPLLPEAWEEIDDEARQVLSVHLGARRLVDFDGPHGWELSAVNLGRLDRLAEPGEEGAELSLRKVRPLAEIRVPFRLSIRDLDAISRGALDAELDPVANAAEDIARVENTAIFRGSEGLGIQGIAETCPHSEYQLPKEASLYPHAVVAAAEELREEGIGGPYGLALGAEPYALLAEAAEDGYPIRRRVDEVIDGPVVWVPSLNGAVLLSLRGGDFVLTVGQDLSVGYRSHDRDEVELFLTETFTFRVIEPAAAVVLTA